MESQDEKKARLSKIRSQTAKRTWKQATPEKRRRMSWGPRNSKENLFSDLPDSPYWELYEQQNGKCAICGYTPEVKSSLCIDHDHVTMEVRGLLCQNCNKALGKLEQENRTENLLTYLSKKHTGILYSTWNKRRRNVKNTNT